MAETLPLASNPSPEAATPLVSVRDLTKHFPIRKGFFNRVVGQVQAVSNVNLDVFPGETLGLVGESGCGKSTLGRCILQLIRPTSGSVQLEGEELTQLPAPQLRRLRQKMQIVFQNPYSSLNPRMSIGDALIEPLEIHRAFPSVHGRQARVKALLDMVGLPQDAQYRYPHEFSGGQRQRVGIARALALNPKFIVADEPVSALDVSIQAQILNLLNDLQKELGLSYLFIAHNLSVVEFISDRVAVMYLGQVVEVAPSNDLYRQPLHPYTQALMQAIPIPDPEATVQRTSRWTLEGDPPNPASPPSGCRFHTRCPFVIERCKQESPALQVFGENHWAACHRVPEWANLDSYPPLPQGN